jgi:Holliday junction resolvase RusA-like endonuclease
MPNGAMIEGSSDSGRAKHKAWRQAVAEAARAAAPPTPHDVPMMAKIAFRFPMPKSRKAAVRRAGIGPHTVKPDKDKVLRCTFDALKDGGLIRDDSLICDYIVEAREVDGWTGAVIVLSEVTL